VPRLSARKWYQFKNANAALDCIKCSVSDHPVTIISGEDEIVEPEANRPLPPR
jgi:hypothetical protein